MARLVAVPVCRKSTFLLLWPGQEHNQEESNRKAISRTVSVICLFLSISVRIHAIVSRRADSGKAWRWFKERTSKKAVRNLQRDARIAWRYRLSVRCLRIKCFRDGPFIARDYQQSVAATPVCSRLVLSLSIVVRYGHR